MNKIVANILLCSLLIVCLFGCSITNDNTGDKNSSNENKDKAEELNEVFDIIRADVSTKTKLGFSVEYEQIYHELKNSGEYKNSDWLESVFIVTVTCNYDLAINEDWYKQCSETDVKSLNQAFYDHYSAGIYGGEYSNISFSPGMHLTYSSLDEFRNDYVAIKALHDLEFVTEVYVVYKYGLPRECMDE